MLNRQSIERVDDVAAWRMCMGCGACAWACPNGAISLCNKLDEGIRPKVDPVRCRRCGRCVQVCPGIGLEHGGFPDGCIEELRTSWGPVLEVWEGYATDPEIRFAGSSGGAATALCLYGLERAGLAGVLQGGPDDTDPLANVPRWSCTRQELLGCSGSRYAPCAPCRAFRRIAESADPCIFVGKPCDVAALRKAQAMDPDLCRKVALTISIFCAGTPATQGTLAMLKAMGVDEPGRVTSLRYRGEGWPGLARARMKDGQEHTLTYARAWGDILSRYGQLRCRLCPDSTGEFADIACGDPWYRRIGTQDPGWSLVLVRSNAGRRYLHKAMEAGYLTLDNCLPDVLPRSQGSVLTRRRQLWGRQAAMRWLGCRVPEYKGFNLVVAWRTLALGTRVRTLLGTARRVISRRWYRPEKEKTG